MSAKSVIAVVMVAILIGVLYVLFEKNFSQISTLSNSKATSSQELGKQNTPSASTPSEQSSVINYPSPTTSPAAITSSTDLSAEANSLEMRDYSLLFEQLKKAAND